MQAPAGWAVCGGVISLRVVGGSCAHGLSRLSDQANVGGPCAGLVHASTCLVTQCV